VYDAESWGNLLFPVATGRNANNLFSMIYPPIDNKRFVRAHCE
jgi:hypothetical protein